MPSAPERSAIVTGAAGGLGLAVAELLLQRGTRVTMVDVDAERLAPRRRRSDRAMLSRRRGSIGHRRVPARRRRGRGALGSRRHPRQLRRHPAPRRFLRLRRGDLLAHHQHEPPLGLLAVPRRHPRDVRAELGADRQPHLDRDPHRRLQPDARRCTRRPRAGSGTSRRRSHAPWLRTASSSTRSRPGHAHADDPRRDTSRRACGGREGHPDRQARASPPRSPRSSRSSRATSTPT